MKKIIVLTLIAFLFSLLSCEKYLNPPSITLNGENVVKSNLNASYIDDGATAEDYNGKDISSDVSISGAVGKDLVGDYMIYYDVVDSKGHNAVTVERLVQVRNEADFLDGFYSVSYDLISGTSTNSSGLTIDEIQSSNTINNRFYLQIPTPLYATVSGNTVTVPLQGDISTEQWQGSGSVDSVGNMLINIDYSNSNSSYSFSIQYDKH